MIDTGYPFYAKDFDNPEPYKVLGVWMYKKEEEAKAYAPSNNKGDDQLGKHKVYRQDEQGNINKEFVNANSR